MNYIDRCESLRSTSSNIAYELERIQSSIQRYIDANLMLNNPDRVLLQGMENQTNRKLDSSREDVIRYVQLLQKSLADLGAILIFSPTG